MTTRPTKAEMTMGLALVASTRSTCLRKRAGCALTDAEHLQVALGYNGPARGLPNGCLLPEMDGGCGCVHAEANACVKARFEAVVACVTRAPCAGCAQLLLNAGVRELWYLDESSAGAEGLVLLRRGGTEVRRMVRPRLAACLGFDGTRGPLAAQ